MTTPTLKVEIAFGTDPLGIPGTWTDVSAYARRVSIRRGRDHELNRSQAGTATVVLNNADRRFDPTYASSPYAPNVIPMRQIRISATWSSTDYFLFTGYIEDWEQDWLPRPIKASGDAEAVLSCVDAFKVLSLYELTGSGLYSEGVLANAPDGYWPFEEASGGTADDLTTNNNVLTVNASHATQGFADSPLAGPNGCLDVIAAGNQPARKSGSLTGAAFGDETTLTYHGWTFECFIKFDTWPPASNVGLFSINGGGAADVEGGIGNVQFTSAGQVVLGWHGAGTGNPGVWRGFTFTPTFTTGVWYHLMIVKDHGDGQLYVNGSLSATGSYPSIDYPHSGIPSGLTPTIVIGATEDEATPYLDAKIAHAAFYANQYTDMGTVAAAHYAANLQGSGTTDTAGAQIGFLLDAIGWPSGRRSLDAGDANMGNLTASGSVLESILAIGEDAEQGLVQMSNGGTLIFHSRSSLLSGHGTAVCTFDDTPSTNVRYSELDARYSDDDLYTQVVVQAQFDGATEQRSLGATVSTYGPRVLRKSANVATDAEAANLANYLAVRYDEPSLRVVRVTLPMVADSFWPTILNIDTHHAKVAVVRTPPGGGSAISVNAHVEGVAWEIDRGEGVWRPSFSLVPAYEEEFWVMGTSAFDDETIFAW